MRFLQPQMDFAVTSLGLFTIVNPSFQGGQSVAAQNGSPTSIQVRKNGKKKFVGNKSDNTIDDYDLATAYDPTSATYSTNSVNVNDNLSAGTLSTMEIVNGGTKLYVGGTSETTIFQYSLDTPNSLADGITDSTKSLDVSGEVTTVKATYTTPDGGTIYVLDAGGVIYEYTMSTAFDLDTASYSNNSFDVSTEEPNPEDIFFSPDGLTLFVVGDTAYVHQYTMDEWDITSATYSEEFYVGDKEATPESIFIADSTLYIVGPTADTVFYWTLQAGNTEQMGIIAQWPFGPVNKGSTSITVNNLNSSTRKVAFLFQALTTDPITHLCFLRTDAAGTSPVWKFGIQGFDANGLPDGTFAGGGSPNSGDYSHGGADATDTFIEVELDNPYTPSSPGEQIWAALEYSSGTIDASNDMDVGYVLSMFPDDGPIVAYIATTGSYLGDHGSPPFGWRTASGYYGNPVVGQSSSTGLIVSTVDDMVGVKWTPTKGGNLTAVDFCVDTGISGNVTHPIKVRVHNITDDVVLLSSATNTGRYTNGNPQTLQRAFLPSPISIEAGKQYFIGVGMSSTPSSGTLSVGLQHVTLPSADWLAALPLGSNFYSSIYDDSAGTYSDDQTIVPSLGMVMA